MGQNLPRKSQKGWDGKCRSLAREKARRERQRTAGLETTLKATQCGNTKKFKKKDVFEGH